MRLRQDLAAPRSALPRHIAVLCDGNRRWARDAGYDDVSYGYRMGAVKIAEMLRWCQDAGIDMATVYLLSTENLQRSEERRVGRECRCGGGTGEEDNQTQARTTRGCETV